MIIRLSKSEVNVLKSFGIDEGEYSIRILPTESDFIFPEKQGPKIRIFRRDCAYFVELPEELKPAYTGHTVDLFDGELIGEPEKIWGMFV